MILVTGGAGFIGSNFVLDWLAGCDEPVVNLDKLTYAGNLQNLASLNGDARHLFLKGDIADSELLERLLAEHRVRAVIHFAAESHKETAIDNYHVTAKELNGNLILLHKVQHGPASQSHGLQVAKLAGIPASVIKEAQNRLKILEKQQLQKPKVIQNDLFAVIETPELEIIERVVEIEKPSAALELLKSIDVDNLSPREALQQLYALKDQLHS